jgi:hypothetical protein
MDMGKEYNALCGLAVLYDTMPPQQQRAYDQRLGTWMLAADIAADESLSEDVARMRRAMATG